MIIATSFPLYESLVFADGESLVESFFAYFNLIDLIVMVSGERIFLSVSKSSLATIFMFAGIGHLTFTIRGSIGATFVAIIKLKWFDG